MDLKPLVQRARQGDVNAFVELARRFQHLAFGSALALVQDFQQAEDIEALAPLWSIGNDGEATVGPLMLERARRLANYFAQPFFVAEPYAGRPGTYVGLKEALQTCRDILDGRHDDIPVGAFYFAGGIDEIRSRVGKVVPSFCASLRQTCGLQNVTDPTTLLGWRSRRPNMLRRRVPGTTEPPAREGAGT